MSQMKAVTSWDIIKLGFGHWEFSLFTCEQALIKKHTMFSWDLGALLMSMHTQIYTQFPNMDTMHSIQRKNHNVVKKNQDLP